MAIYEDEWLRIELTGELPKTKIYSIISKSSDCELGKIKWYPIWRHYCFFPILAFEIVLSDRCLLAIGEFALKLNQEHKKNV